MEAWDYVSQFGHQKDALFEREEETRVKKWYCDLIEMMKVAYKDEYTIGSLEEFSWMWFSDEIAGTAGDDVVDVDIERAMKQIWHHARNPIDIYTLQNTSKTRTNRDNVMIKL